MTTGDIILHIFCEVDDRVARLAQSLEHQVTADVARAQNGDFDFIVAGCSHRFN